MQYTSCFIKHELTLRIPLSTTRSGRFCLFSDILLWLVLPAPLALLAAAIWPARGSNAAAIVCSRAIGAVSVALAIAAGAACVVGVAGPVHTALVGVAGIGFDLYLDGLSSAMSCLVAFVGLNIVLFSRNYLAGDPAQARFFRLLCAALACVFTLIVCGNLFALALAWIATSWCLHQLLLIYPERPAARLAAGKIAIISRLSDLSLLVALVLLYRTFHSLDVSSILAATTALRGSPAPGELQVATIALVIAALLKSAQFPVHGWLLEAMETPTPVSALLHAGIINAGGFLVLRLSPVVSLSGASLDTLAIVGALTALFGSIVMLTQTSIKVRLAHSTIAQMGFMMLECGLAAFPAALLHIMAHSLYKAHAFLSSGSVIDLARASWIPSPGGKPHPARLVIAIAAVLAVTFVVSRIAGASLLEKPGVFALSAIVLLGLIDLIAKGIDERPNAYVVGRVLALASITAAVFFGLQIGMERLMVGTFPAAQPLRSVLDAIIVSFVVLAFAAVTYFQATLPTRALERWSALYAIVSNGFYVNTFINRVVKTLTSNRTAGQTR